MRISEILKPDCVKIPLASTDKQAAINELIDLLGEQGLVHDLESLKDAVWQRESTRTTGIGHGLAIPHGKSNCVDSLIMAIGKPATPIDFQSIDRRPVNVIILLVSPTNQTGAHIQALAQISRMMTDDGFRGQVRDAGSAEALYELIETHEASMPG